MQPQIVHESEVHRQHVRLKIPIQAEIDGIRYQVDDWSIGGFGVESVMTSRQPGERFPVRLIFHVRGVRHDHALRGAHGLRRPGSRPLRLRLPRPVAASRWRSSAIWSTPISSGEVVSAGDILQVRARDNTAPGAPAGGLRPLRRERAAGGAAAALRHDRGLRPRRARCCCSWWSSASRTAISPSTATDAVVEAPTVRIRAPIVGRFVTALQAGPGGAARQRCSACSTASTAPWSRSRARATAWCSSSSRCNGQHYQAGEPLVVLIEAEPAADGPRAAAARAGRAASRSAIAPRSACPAGASRCSARSSGSTCAPAARRCATAMARRRSRAASPR